MAGMVYLSVMGRLRRWSRRETARANVRRARATALALLTATATLAVLLAVLSHQAWPPVVVAILGTLPALYLAWLAVPGVISPPEPATAGKPALPGSAEGPMGRPLEEVTDPFALEVHRPLQPEGVQHDLPVLPAYVPRAHDAALAGLVTAAAAGTSGIAVLVGGSSTGKTRACWEALQLVRDQPEQWRLWHPIDPARPTAALRELVAIGPRTVVWLNEAQFYLDVLEGGLGEQVAAGLRALLRDRDRAPVLVLATLWPQFWHTLTSRPPVGPDPHEQARELLVGHDITVPPAFTAAQLAEATAASDVRLAAAAEAQDGQVTQFLAGVPELLARYRNAPPAAKALIHAGMDARRLGMRSALSGDFLETAAPGYLTDSEWDQLAEAWLDQALAYTAADAKGIRGPLTRIRPRLGHRAAGADDGLSGAFYRLADYLDQYGRRARRGQIVPPSTWQAALDHLHDPADTTRLADRALERMLYCYAIPLYRHAANAGDERAAWGLAGLLARRGDLDQAEQVLRTRADVGDQHAAEELARALARRGDLRGLGARADADDWDTAEPLARPLAKRGGKHSAWRQVWDMVQGGNTDELYALANAGLPAERDDLDDLRARADTGDLDAAMQLAELLVERGDLDELRARVRIGDRFAALCLPWALTRQGRDEEAQRLRRFGLNPDGSIARA